jgi:hypothetical protein
VTSRLDCRFAASHLTGRRNLRRVVESHICQHYKNIAQWHIVLVKKNTLFLGRRLSYSVTFRVILNQEFHSFAILVGTKKIL